MESLTPLVSISAMANDGEVDEVHRELFNLWFMLISAIKTLPVCHYFAMVKDKLITRNGIQYVYCCLLCFVKHPSKFLDTLVAVYNDSTTNVHKHIDSTHLSLHLARMRQSLEPKQLISILISTSASANNIHAFIESGNDAIIERVHMFVTQLVINCKALLSLATNVDLNEVIQVTSYLKPRSYVPMTPNKINHALISMFSKFTKCINLLIVKACAMYMMCSQTP